MKKYYVTSEERLRKKLGMTQVQFANLLGVHRSTISMVECGCRDLKVSISIKLRNIIIAMNAIDTTPVKPQELEPWQKEKIMTKLVHRIDNMEFKVKCLNRRIEKMFQKFTDASKSLFVMNDQINNPQTGELERLQAIATYHKMNYIIDRNKPFVQRMLIFDRDKLQEYVDRLKVELEQYKD